MAKAQIARKSTWVDMTPFVDVAFLLLTFFMLATKPKPPSEVPVDTPSSTASIKIPDNNIQILVDKHSRVFIGFDGPATREKVLEKVASKFNINFTSAEKASFAGLDQIGVPQGRLKWFLGLTRDQQKEYVSDTNAIKGIPVDTGANAKTNDFDTWIRQGRLSNPSAFIAIKGDRNANVPVFNRIIKVFQEQDLNRFNLITGMAGGTTSLPSESK